MRFYTHLLFGLLVGKWIASFLNFHWIFFIWVSIFSLLPDIDEPSSFLGRRLPFLSKPFRFFFGHRQLFHSLLLLFPVFLFLAIFPMAAIAFLCGALSHLFLDALTKEGIQPLYPLKWKLNGMFKTGGIAEHVILAGCVVGLAV
ncbi:metal-dependent hydrolase [Candidatus Woesearchaeota archaeon]|nr:metal-dependent hydrolase [Candidatus Woesearchaeota archaeon]